ARGDNEDFEPRRVELWINDFRLKAWNVTGSSFEQSVQIKLDQLRSGDNRLTLQVFNKVEGRSEKWAVLKNPNPALEPRLIGLSVGINNYDQGGFAEGKKKFGNLSFSRNDAEKQREVWLKLAGNMYEKATILPRLDADAHRDKLVEALEQLAKE